MNAKIPFAPIVLAMALVAGQAFADAGHGHADMNMAFGSPGQEADVTMTIRVEANDKFRFVFDRTDIRHGDVVKFIVTNTGKVKHEFSIGDVPYQRAHAVMMKKMPGMVHNDPNMATLEPGETKTLVWKFDKAVSTEIVFACHEPGHYEAGMIQRAKLQK